MEKILNSKTLWQNFDPNQEQLNVNLLNVTERDGIVTKQLYFTGRSFGDKCTRVFATICSKSVNSTKPAILLVGDYKEPIQTDKLCYLAEHGFTAMSIDFAGRTECGLHTIYAQDVEYCNADVAVDLFQIDTTARNTKIYEYALNCRRAITYLVSQTKASEVHLLTVGKGAYVGLIVLGVDERIARGACLFGNLNQKHPYVREESMEDVLGMGLTDMDDMLQSHLEGHTKAQNWTVTLAPQTYASQIKVPMYVVMSANSAHVDVLENDVIFRRLPEQSRLVVLPETYDCITETYMQGVFKWFKGAEPPRQPELDSFWDGENYCLGVDAVGSIKKTSIWYAVNPRGKARFWRKATDLKKVGNKYVAKLDLYQQNCQVWAFALVDGDIAMSTTIFNEEVQAKKVRFANNIVFSGNSSQMLIPISTTQSWLTPNLACNLEKGYLDIVGAKGNAMATFALNDYGVRKEGLLNVVFDVCSNVAQPLYLYVVCNFGEENDVYCQQVNILGNGKWQRVTIDGENFRRTTDGKQLVDTEPAEMLTIYAKQEIIVNNIVLV